MDITHCGGRPSAAAGPDDYSELSDRVPLGEVWKCPDLSSRDRSLITVAALVSGYRHNELPGHLAPLRTV